MRRKLTAALVLVAAFAGTTHAKSKHKPTEYDRTVDSDLGRAIIDEARKQKVPPEIALAFCRKESGCGIVDPVKAAKKGYVKVGLRCVSGNCGWLQVNFTTWSHHPSFIRTIRKREDLFGISGARIGVQIVARYYHRFKHKANWQGHYKNGEKLLTDGIVYAKKVQEYTVAFRAALKRFESREVNSE